MGCRNHFQAYYQGKLLFRTHRERNWAVAFCRNFILSSLSATPTNCFPLKQGHTAKLCWRWKLFYEVSQLNIITGFRGLLEGLIVWRRAKGHGIFPPTRRRSPRLSPDELSLVAHSFPFCVVRSRWPRHVTKAAPTRSHSRILSLARGVWNG